MSETAKKLFDGLKIAAHALTPDMKRVGAEVKAEMSRLGKQGAMELACALFAGHTFVPYGPGQKDPGIKREDVDSPEHSIDRAQGLGSRGRE